MIRIWKPLFGAVIFALFCVGCDSGGNEVSLSPSTGGTEVRNNESPLEAVLGSPLATSESSNYARLAEIGKIEERTATCMRQNGFEYTPNLVDEQATHQALVGNEESLGQTWTAQFGFGISTLRFPQAVLPPGLIGHAGVLTDPESSEDPNADYMRNLSEPEREQYEHALYGDAPAWTAAPSEAEIDDFLANRESVGCREQADEEVTNRAAVTAFADEFNDELEDMYARIESDQRVVAFRDRVADCMLEKGYTAPNIVEARREIGQELADLTGGLPDPTSVDFDELARLQDRELELARALDDCDGGQAAEIQTLQPIHIEYEKRFVNAHSDALTALDLVDAASD